MTGLSDTSPEAEEILRQAYRRMSPAAKLRQMGSLYRTAKVLHAIGVRQRNPQATEEMIQDEWRLQALGEELVRQIKEARSAK